MPQYTNTSLTSAVTQLSARLNDSLNIHYTQTEVQNAIVESLRILQALTGFYRERETFKTSASQVFYDLRYALDTPVGSTYPYSFTVTDNQLLSEIQAHLVEQVQNPQSVILQFPITTIAQAMTRTRDQFLTDTGMVVTRTVPFSGMPSNGRINLPQSLLDVRRAAWMDSTTQRTYRLKRTDEYASLGYQPGWRQNPALPYSYSVALTPPISLQLIPTPINTGSLDLCSLNSGPTLNCAPSSPVAIGIMDDFCWGVKYGTIADLLGEDGPDADPARSAYCRTLYNLAVSIAKKTITVLLAQIEDIETSISGIDDFDSYKTGWQNQTPALPTDILTVSPNLLSLSSPPDSTYTLSLDMVRTMPVPQSPADFLQVDQSMIESVLDLAQHIASLKEAGEEFQSTFPLRDNFLRLAGTLNSRLQANDFYKLLLEQPATRPELEVPRLMKETGNA